MYVCMNVCMYVCMYIYIAIYCNIGASKMSSENWVIFDHQETHLASGTAGTPEPLQIRVACDEAQVALHLRIPGDNDPKNPAK